MFNGVRFSPTVFNLTHCHFAEIHGFDIFSSINITAVPQNARHLKSLSEYLKGQYQIENRDRH
jgi:hypothetical protein